MTALTYDLIDKEQIPNLKFGHDDVLTDLPAAKKEYTIFPELPC